MRRSLAALSAAAILIPVAVTTAPSSASAATNELTVTTYDRTGAKVTTTVSVISLKTNSTYRLTSGKPRSLPKGPYAVLAKIHTKPDGSDTLGARVLTVSGSTKTSIDARNGRPIKISLNPALSEDSQIINARICARNTNWTTAEAFNVPGKVYLVPHSSDYLRFAYMSQWTEPAATDAGSAYVVKGGTVALPSSFSRTVSRSSLATVTMYARRGPAGSPDSDVAVQSAASGCLRDMYRGLYSGQAPFQLTTHLSPGNWTLRAHSFYGSSNIGHYSKTRTLESGKSYSQVFFRSAWGPAERLPHVVYKRLDFVTDGMFMDPGFGGSLSSYGSEAAAKSLVTLSKGSTTLKRQWRTEWGSSDTSIFSYRLPSAGWYTLNVDARRYHPEVTYPADLQSNRTTATFRFYADPNKSEVAPLFLPRFTPLGLDMMNRAQPGSSTTMSLQLQRPRQSPDSKMTSVTPKTVTVRASFDGGTTWRSAKVTYSNGKWTAVVQNPMSGMVTLRAKVTDAKGNSTEVTIYRAYAIG
ncbi:MAG TPA: hypothetical protein VFX61_23395 [Micromonosporaceae bacterium]|nr:hypothetical protein [Micromonosporaceae bacterium]